MVSKKKEVLPPHSPLGASSAERWMNCPGSVSLIKSLPKLVVADPEYRTSGSAAHDAIAHCLTGSGTEPWEIIGQRFGSNIDPDTGVKGMAVTQEMADAIQVFIDEANRLSEGADETYIEAHLNNPEVKWEYGTIDFGAVHPGILYIRDFKYGQGILVETKDNTQMLYYAHLLLLRHPDVRKVNMKIIQPRVFHEIEEEPWEVDAEYIMEWAENVLIPAMELTTVSETLKPGYWCRFCPAKEGLACPKLKAQYEAARAMPPETSKALDDAALLAAWKTMETVRMHMKAIGDEVLRRLLAGQMKDNGVVKLVHKKANRVWTPEAEAIFRNKFGNEVMGAPQFKSPAEMEKLSPDAKKLVKEYAYTPQSGYTVAELDDKRAAAKPKSATEGFAGALAAIDDL